MNTSLELSDMGLMPLSREEMMEINGGFAWLALVVIPIGIGSVNSFLNNFGDLRAGFWDGVDGTPLSAPKGCN